MIMIPDASQSSTSGPGAPLPAPAASPLHDRRDDLRLMATTIDILGGDWTLLIVQEALSGTTRFNAFRERLGLRPTILATRLRALIAHGVFETRACAHRRGWQEYHLTKKGRALQGAVSVLRQWARDH